MQKKQLRALVMAFISPRCAVYSRGTSSVRTQKWWMLPRVLIRGLTLNTTIIIIAIIIAK
tara:strand:+ start:530 stop:709 length:180 start_codon:yes stop_codon:yes gene_type:complete